MLQLRAFAAGKPAATPRQTPPRSTETSATARTLCPPPPRSTPHGADSVNRTRRARPARCAAVDAAAETAGARAATDERYMARALELARKGLGQTYPNPAVGCVLVKDGEVIGEGFHPRAGEPHAEVFALRAAGQRAAGATAYVTLEPCNHYGRTPPCSKAMVDAKVARVVVGVVDPNPLVGGGGIKHLVSRGIEVAYPCLERECYSINEEFMLRMQQGSNEG